MLWLFGHHPVAFAWRNPERGCRRLLVTGGALESLEPALAEGRRAGLTRPEPERVERDAIDRLFPPGTVHQGVALLVEPLPEPLLEAVLHGAEGPAALLVLDQITDPHNVGAILRSAAAFGAAAVVTTERHAPAATATLAKSASGALDLVPLVRVVNLARALDQAKEAGFWCVGLDERGRSRLCDLNVPDRIALVLGAEGTGMRRLTRERCDFLAGLPTDGPLATLNVSNAAAVGLYEWRRRRP